MKHFLANEARREGTQKRGGHQPTISLDFRSGENAYRLIEPADNLTPERLFEKRWAMALLDLVLGRLRAEFCALGNAALFDSLKQFLAGSPAKQPCEANKAGPTCPDSPANLRSVPGVDRKLAPSPLPSTYAEVAQQHGMTEGAVRVAAHRMRRRYRKLLMEEIARTIVDPQTLEDELSELLAVLGSEK